MVLVDASAVVAILLKEADEYQFRDFLLEQPSVKMAAPTYLECNMVAVSKFGPEGLKVMSELIDALEIEIVPFNAAAAKLASAAFVKYGKGRGHPAQLNFGDCISYAVSKIEMMPLLFKGDDFRKTDVECAI